jgi:hypothetical protein
MIGLVILHPVFSSHQISANTSHLFISAADDRSGVRHRFSDFRRNGQSVVFFLTANGAGRDLHS